MIMNSLLVVTSNKHDPNPEDLQKAGMAFGLRTEVVEYAELNWEFGIEELKIRTKGIEIGEFDAFILRGAGVRNTLAKRHRGVLADWLLTKNKRVLNGRYFAEYSGGLTKLEQLWIMLKEGVATIPTKIIGSIDSYPSELPDYPFVTKPLAGSQGEGITLVSNDSLRRRAFSLNPPQQLLIQPVLPNKVDYRVIVLNGKVLGIMQRNAGDGMFVTNVSAGGIASKVDIRADFKQLAKRASELFDLDFVGVDIMLDDSGEPRVLELNAAAEFQGFQKACQVNVAEKMISYLLK